MSNRELKWNIGLGVASFLCILFAGFATDPILFIFLLTFGVGMTALFTVYTVGTLKKWDIERLKKLKSNESAVIWVWVTAALTIGLFSIVWWAISYPLFVIIDTYNTIFTTPEEIAPMVSLLYRMIVWFGGIIIFGVIIWALVSSYQGQHTAQPVSPYYG